MARHSFTEVTRTSWSTRLARSVTGVLGGLAILVVSVGVLFWNEGRAVRRAKDLEAGAGAAVQVATDRVERANDGRLVHFAGQATTVETLADRSFEVSANALRLRRHVEMFQWTEDSHKETRELPGGDTESRTTYTYHTNWSEQPIRSSSFRMREGHENPPDMPFRSETYDASRATVGAFELPADLVSKLSDFRPIAPPLAAGPTQQVTGDTLYVGAGKGNGPDPANPRVGDIRLSWSVVEPGPVSVIGVQHAATLGPWRGPSGSTVFEITPGRQDAESMFGRLEAQNTNLTWILRGGGALMLFIGFCMVLAPLGVLAGVLPPVASLVRLGTGAVAFLLTAAVGLTTISVGWLAYRPLIGVPLALAAAASLAGLVVLLRRHKPAPQPQHAGAARTREAA